MSTASDMRIFVQVVESSSFSTAAAALGLTPSAVSKIVTKLEDRLGVRLLHRTTRRLALTMEGELYFARARQIVSDIADAETEVARVHGVPRGRIRVATSAAFGVSQLAPILPDFLQRYPEISVDLSLTDRVVDLVDEQIDVAIRAGRLTDATLIARQIATYRRVICAAPAYLARKGMPRNPAALPGWPRSR
jgi:DNA-binding transcriptional LysR family regulator